MQHFDFDLGDGVMYGPLGRDRKDAAENLAAELARVAGDRKWDWAMRQLKARHLLKLLDVIYHL